MMQNDDFIAAYLASVRTTCGAERGAETMVSAPIGANGAAAAAATTPQALSVEQRLVEARMESVFEQRVAQIRAGLAQQDQRTPHRRIPVQHRLFNK